MVAPCPPAPGEPAWCYGTMDSGKSTLALQNNYNYVQAGRRGHLFTMRRGRVRW